MKSGILMMMKQAAEIVRVEQRSIGCLLNLMPLAGWKTILLPLMAPKSVVV